ncbi:DUF4431 domain-containing protein [Achromobacter sp. DH1f]|uniref:DUF4431 domain-containing protein n=1 Tax=Achromobacter sp. DH1f TaxID=1397275 RepID=UPI000E1FC081|nr:DUF4431 domain-containing protein [Achromobacter sp. DH1f]
MKTILITIALAMSTTMAATHAQSISYDQPIVLSGRLEMLTGVDIQRGKEVEVRYPALILDRKISVIPSTTDIGNTPQATGIVQLAISDGSQREFVKKVAGGRASISCASLYSWHTAHHFAPVLCNVDRVLDVTQ